jgi:GTP-binding protein
MDYIVCLKAHYSVKVKDKFIIVTPQGGNGGNGGDIIFKADGTLNSLSCIRKAHYFGNNGEKGRSKSMGGRNAKDITINVPVGTLAYEIIRQDDYNYTKKELRAEKAYKLKLLADFNIEGKEVIMCKGGQAGIGNSTKRNMYKDNPLLQGKPGEEKEIVKYDSKYRN